MNEHEKYMRQCLSLAQKGNGYVSPNPMVGSVIVHNNRVIGKGFHQKHGQAHAEVNAINSVAEKNLLAESTIYVSLEPCSHFGLTPPCSDLIIKMKIPKVVIGAVDPNEKVAGRGIERLKNAGVEVITGILEGECRELNKRFYTFHEKRRPYIFLKWAETADGFIDYARTSREFGQPSWITGEKALIKVHQMRAAEDAILVGTNTALKDNPSLTVRRCKGKNPLRLVIDRLLQLPGNLSLFDGKTPTVVFNSLVSKTVGSIEYVKIDFGGEVEIQILDFLYQRNILSLIIEGGRKTLESFLEKGLWDEAYRFTGEKQFDKGIRAPKIQAALTQTEYYDSDKLFIYRNQN